MDWNYANVFDAIAQNVPAEQEAFVHPGATRTWQGTTQRSNALARSFLDFGLKADSKVAFMMRNRPEYLETLFACFKARLVHVNVNFRYTGSELFFIFDNSDSEIIVYGEEFAEVIAELKPQLTKVKAFVEVSEGAPNNDFAVHYDALCKGNSETLNIERSGDDLLMVYTGGTTGSPKGVMWPQANLWRAMGSGAPGPGMPKPMSMDEHIANVMAVKKPERQLVLAPFMHGAAMMTSLTVLGLGGAILTLPGIKFDPKESLKAISDFKATRVLIVGDAFAKPLLKELDANPDAYDISSLTAMVSSGAMWSKDSKMGLLRHNSHMVIVDAYGSSEGIGLGTSITTAKGSKGTAKFALSGHTKLFSEDFREIKPGSTERGLVAQTGAIPVGYYKDPEKTAKTFPMIDGVRYSIPGDWATAEADGTLTLLGRGNQCINSGGEKIFPEEVEEALKTHPNVDDTLVLGTADEKWGQAVTALIKMDTPTQPSDLTAHVKKSIAAYKAPKTYIFVDHIPRQPNGKADYVTAKKMVEERLKG